MTKQPRAASASPAGGIVTAPDAAVDRALRVGLTILLALQAVGAWFPGPLLWGVNHLAWFPIPLRLLIPLLGLAVIWSPPGARFGTWLQELLAPRILGSQPVAFGVVPGLGMAFFWLLRDRLHLLGDGQLLTEIVARGTHYHGFDFMTYHLHARIFGGLGLAGEAAAQQVFATISIVMGGAWLAAAAWGARRLGSGGSGDGQSSDVQSTGLLLYGLLVFCAPVQLFCGYVEVYAPLAVALLVFVLTLALYYRDQAPAWRVALAWGVAFFLHATALFLAPLLLAMVIWPSPGDARPLWRRLLAAAAPPLACLLAALAIYQFGGYTSERFATDFPRLGQAGDSIFVPLLGRDGLLSWRHGKDVLNLLLLLASVPVALLLAAWPAVRARGGWWRLSRGTLVLLGGGDLVVLLMIVVHLKLGMARDWDLFAPAAAVFPVATCLLVARMGPRSGHRNGAVIAVAALLTLPWLALNADPDRAVARVTSVVADQAPFPRGLLHEQLARVYRLRGDAREALREYRTAAEVCPGNPRFPTLYGHMLFRDGDHLGARVAFDRALAADSTYADALKMGVITRMVREELPGALPLARRLAGRPGEDAEAAAAHGLIAEELGLVEEAIRAYTRALRHDPRRADLLERRGGLELVSGQFGPAEADFRAHLALRPSSVSGRVGLADAIWQDAVNRPQARPAAERRRRLQEVATLLAELARAGAEGVLAPEQLAAWRGAVAAALAAD